MSTYLLLLFVSLMVGAYSASICDTFGVSGCIQHCRTQGHSYGICHGIVGNLGCLCQFGQSNLIRV